MKIKMSFFKVAIPIVFITVLLFGWQGLTSEQSPAVGGKAPDFSLKTHDGKDFTLSKLQGRRGAVLVFFATWCPSCMQEVPHIKEFVEKVRDKDILVYGVNLKQPLNTVKDFVKKYKVNYRILLDVEGNVGKQYNVRYIPHIVAIDAEGIVRFKGAPLPKDTDKLIAQLTAPLSKDAKKDGAKNKADAPKKIDRIEDGVSYISKETLQSWTKKYKDMVIIDVLSSESYAKAHVKGAINIPLAQIEKRADELDKNARIVTYCANFKCKASTAAAKKLTKLGFKNVHDYEGGIKDWKEANLPVGP